MNTVDRAREAWGCPVPDWIHALASACDASTQATVAEELGYSRTAISLLVNRKYDRDHTAIEAVIREKLMRVTVGCPVLGQIEAADCRGHQAARFRGHNPVTVALFRACRGGCAHSSLSEGASA